MLTEQALAQAYGDGADPSDPISTYVSAAPTITANLTAAEALQRFSSERSSLIVVDVAGALLGYISPSDLWGAAQEYVRPPLVGGMATPLGVYLTNGSIAAGAKAYAIALSGGLMFLFLFVGELLAFGLSTYLSKRLHANEAASLVDMVLPLTCFMALMRFSPLAGIHAAEHMTVHAIEREEPLEIEVVRRMPRVHPRCGTNLAVGMSLFMALALSDFGFSKENQPLQFILAAVLVLLTWRKIGGFVQYWITTKRPTDKQIAMGITAGKELLNKYRAEPIVYVPIYRRLWMSGIPYALVGSTAMGLLAAGIAKLFGLDLPISP